MGGYPCPDPGLAGGASILHGSGVPISCMRGIPILAGVAPKGTWDQRLSYPLEGTWNQRLGYPSEKDLGSEAGEGTRDQRLGYPPWTDRQTPVTRQPSRHITQTAIITKSPPLERGTASKVQVPLSCRTSSPVLSSGTLPPPPRGEKDTYEDLTTHRISYVDGNYSVNILGQFSVADLGVRDMCLPTKISVSCSFQKKGSNSSLAPPRGCQPPLENPSSVTEKSHQNHTKR